MRHIRSKLHRILRALLVWLLLFLPLSIGTIAEAQDDERDTVPRTGTLTGRVINENGQPVPHASIFVTAPMALPQPRITLTDDAGNFGVAAFKKAHRGHSSLDGEGDTLRIP